MLPYNLLGSWEKFQLNFTAITIIFIQENNIDNNVCEIVAHLSQPQCANIPWLVEFSVNHLESLLLIK